MAEQDLTAYIRLIEAEVERGLPALPPSLSGVGEMMRYSLAGGGKRIRPLLTLLFCEAAGGDPENALPFAAAVEYVHTYSLIHDDLPCMDDDDVRRGKPSSHVRFGEANALLAGDALLTHAFSAVAKAAETGKVPAENAVAAVRELSLLAGAPGMVGGQYLDLKNEGGGSDADSLLEMDSLKTGALIEAACVLGLLAAGAPEPLFMPARKFARALGLAFQIKDDLIEYEDENEKSDEKNEKSTYITGFGAAEAARLAADYTRQAVDALSAFGEKGDSLAALAAALLDRKS
jgi:geranylgeranyl diphosphate synthase type II